MIPPIIVINGPTAVGKTSVINRLLQRMLILQTATTYTTRALRPGQKEDKKLVSISEKDFAAKVKGGTILEWTRYNGDCYGTASKSLTATKGKPLLLNLDVRGTRFIKRRFTRACLIFIRPESMKQIRQRLLARGLTPSQFRRRYGEAVAAMKGAHIYDYQVINHEGKVNQTVSQIQNLIKNYLKTQKTAAIIDKKAKRRYYPLA
ncbi:MAG: hypothetical protein V1846_03430 [Candidatus Komeilibacteria bacterium]